MKSGILTASIAVLALTACGGESSSSNSLKVQSSAELLASLPQANDALSTTTPEGLWFLSGSVTFKHTRPDNTDLTRIENSRELVLLEHKTDGKYRVHSCAFSIDDVDLTLTEGTLTGEEKETDETYFNQDTVKLALENNLKFTGTYNGTTREKEVGDEFENVDSGTIVGIKVSDANSFQTATELDIVLKGKLNNGTEMNLADFPSNMHCLALRKFQAKGKVEGKKGEINADIIAFESSSSYAEFDTQTGKLDGKSSNSVDYESDFTSLTSEGDFTCFEDEDDCVKATSVTITTNSSQTAISGSAVGKNENNDTLSMEFSVTIK